MDHQFKKMTVEELLIAKSNLELNLVQMIRERVAAFEANTNTHISEIIVNVHAINYPRETVVNEVNTKIICPTEGGELVTLS